ncbi:MAG: hypothetical protein V4603_12440 [Pseudomonadota bacterium]
MPGKRIRKWVGTTLLICAVAFVAAEKLNFLQTDSVAAALCTTNLFAGEPDALGAVLPYKDAIAAAARQYDLPPELLAVNIYSHQRDLTAFRKFTDCAGSAMNWDLSLGLAQIRVSNAANNDGLEWATLAPAARKRYRAMLLEPHANIEYQARELRALLERPNRFPGITAEAIMHDPFVMALLISEYRQGREAAASDVSKLSGRAFWDLQLLLRETLYIFGRDSADIVQIQHTVRPYLDEVYCNGEIFNSKACDQWNREILTYNIK